MILPAALLMLAGCSKTGTPTATAPAAASQLPADSQDSGAPRVQAAAQPSPQPSPYGSSTPIAGVAAPPPPAEPAPSPFGDPPPPPPPPPDNTQSADRIIPGNLMPAALSIPAGAPLVVRVDESIDTRRNRAGDGFDATLTEALVVDGRTALPAGTRFHGHVTQAKASGRLKGRAVLVLTLDSFRMGGRRYPIRSNYVERESGNHRKRNEVAIGGGTGFGAAMGAIAGGGAGAAIGAAAGAGAGTIGAAITGKKEVGIRAESLLRFKLQAPVAL